jgi:hypothetical protein
MEAKIIGWEVTNRNTGLVKTYKTLAAASKAANRADNAYGAYICSKRAIWG